MAINRKVSGHNGNNISSIYCLSVLLSASASHFLELSNLPSEFWLCFNFLLFLLTNNPTVAFQAKSSSNPSETLSKENE